MIKQDFYIANLIARYLSEEITPEETIKLTAWREESTAHEILFKKICDEENQKQHFRKNTAFNPSSGWKEVEKRIKRNNNRSRYIKIVSYAAIILLPVLFVSISMKFTSPVSLSDKQFIAQSILPGESQAILTLEDGQTIHINKETESLLEKIDGARVHMDSTMLNYQVTSKTAPKNKPVYNKVETPRGGEYALLLSDGTKVHLNAMTSLRFPVTFDNGPRKVELEGEAYFDVVKDETRPFIVQTHLGEVTVLGTAFNINAYTDASVYTTLVHGKVQFSSSSIGTIILSPGEQAVVSANGSEKRMVDLDEYVGWVDGRYVFNNRPLGEIMQTFERWYDIQVYYETPHLRDITYSGSLKRYGTINSFLDALELTGDLTYKISGRNILIYDKVEELE